MIGVIMTWIPAIIVSYLTDGHKKMCEFDRKLVPPFVRKMLPEKCRCNTELKAVNTQISHRKSENNENGTQSEATKLIETNKLTESMNINNQRT